MGMSALALFLDLLGIVFLVIAISQLGQQEEMVGREFVAIVQIVLIVGIIWQLVQMVIVGIQIGMVKRAMDADIGKDAVPSI